MTQQQQQQQDSQQWACSVCTYLNANNDFLACQMCGNVREERIHPDANEEASPSSFQENRRHDEEEDDVFKMHENALMEERMKEIMAMQREIMENLKIENEGGKGSSSSKTGVREEPTEATTDTESTELSLASGGSGVSALEDELRRKRNERSRQIEARLRASHEHPESLSSSVTALRSQQHPHYRESLTSSIMSSGKGVPTDATPNVPPTVAPTVATPSSPPTRSPKPGVPNRRAMLQEQWKEESQQQRMDHMFNVQDELWDRVSTPANAFSSSSSSSGALPAAANRRSSSAVRPAGGKRRQLGNLFRRHSQAPIQR